LLGEIRDVCSKNWKDAADKAVRAHHLDAILSCSNERFEEKGHAVVEEAVTSEGASRIRETGKL
jgi:hypothetical protein